MPSLQVPFNHVFFDIDNMKNISKNLFMSKQVLEINKDNKCLNQKKKQKNIDNVDNIDNIDNIYNIDNVNSFFIEYEFEINDSLSLLQPCIFDELKNNIEPNNQTNFMKYRINISIIIYIFYIFFTIYVQDSSAQKKTQNECYGDLIFDEGFIKSLILSNKSQNNDININIHPAFLKNERIDIDYSKNDIYYNTCKHVVIIINKKNENKKVNTSFNILCINLLYKIGSDADNKIIYSDNDNISINKTYIPLIIWNPIDNINNKMTTDKMNLQSQKNIDIFIPSVNKYNLNFDTIFSKKYNELDSLYYKDCLGFENE